MNLESILANGYVSFSRGDSHFCLDVRYVREIVDGSGFAVRSELPGLRLVTLRDSPLQVVDIAAPRNRAAFQDQLPLIIVVELDRDEATAVVGIVADRIDSKLLISAIATPLAAGCIDAAQVLREKLPDSAYLATR